MKAILSSILFVIAASVAVAQPAGVVSFTEAIDHAVQRTVKLPGSVESRMAGVVASEAAGLVVEMAVQAGDRVAKGDTLVRLRQVTYQLQLEAAEGSLKEAQARLALAESTLRRSRRLFDEEVISQGDLDDANSEFAAWQGRIDQTTAQIGQIKVALDRSVVRAPYAGVVVEKRTDVGQWMQIGGPVVEMITLDDLEIRVDVPERYFDRLKTGTRVNVGFASVPGYAITGSIQAIVPRADPKARSFPVKVAFVDSAARIGVGMLAEVELPVGELATATLVPKDAVTRHGSQNMVYRIGEDGSVEPVPVETGAGVGEWIVITGAVSAGDRVVTRGNERLRPGQSVEAELLRYALP